MLEPLISTDAMATSAPAPSTTSKPRPLDHAVWSDLVRRIDAIVPDERRFRHVHLDGDDRAGSRDLAGPERLPGHALVDDQIEHLARTSRRAPRSPPAVI